MPLPSPASWGAPALAGTRYVRDQTNAKQAVHQCGQAGQSAVDREDGVVWPAVSQTRALHHVRQIVGLNGASGRLVSTQAPHGSRDRGFQPIAELLEQLVGGVCGRVHVHTCSSCPDLGRAHGDGRAADRRAW